MMIGTMCIKTLQWGQIDEKIFAIDEYFIEFRGIFIYNISVEM